MLHVRETFMKTTTPLGTVLTAALVSTLACAVPPEPLRFAESLPADPSTAHMPYDVGELPPETFDHAERLYAQQCALCHGDKGRGDGPASALLMPPPRDFGEGRFQLVSTDNGFPTDDDLSRLLERGMPGSSMPSYGWLPREDIDQLVAYVRKLSIESMVDRMTRRGISEGEAYESARARMSPGNRIAVGPEPATDTATLERGRAIYGATCTYCHGEDGRGRREEPRWNERGDIEWARDFTSGVLKGGVTHEELAYRIESGMPGSSMPATRFDDPAERSALIAYVRSLMPEDAAERLVRRRGSLPAARVDDLPTSADDETWTRTEPLEVVLAPNSWRDDSIFGATVQAVHDGERIAVRVCWDDVTRNDRPFGEFEHPDQVALMLSGEGTQPAYGMGSPQNAVDLWHWTAFRMEEVVGALDLLDNETRQRGDVLSEGGIADTPAYVPARDVGEGTCVLTAHGMDARKKAPVGIDASTRRDDGGWEVVFVRELGPRSGDEVLLVPGHGALFTVALWNGAARDHGAQKSISIWQELQLEQ
jgi:DMSO reductase family type II enzyme heme b subunit